MDDMSSMLGDHMFAGLQDFTITEDTTTLCCTDQNPRRRSLKSAANTQFGFENRAFEIEDAVPPVRYASLAQFCEGNDIARKSFKKLNRNKSASLKKQLSNHAGHAASDIVEENSLELTNESDKFNLNTIKIQIQGSHSDLTDMTEYEINQTATAIDYKGLFIEKESEDEEKDDTATEKRFPKVNL